MNYFTKTTLLNSKDNDPWLTFNHLLNYAKELSISVIVVPFFDKNIINTAKDLIRFLKLVESKVIEIFDTEVFLCIETTLKPKHLLSVFNKTRTPVKICYDLGNAAALGFDIKNEIKLLGDHIGLVHIKDRKKNDGPNVLMGDGDVDFVAAFKALKEIGYKGNYTLETAVGNNPISNAKKHLKKVQDLIYSYL